MKRYQHLTRAERLEFSILVKKGYSLRAIARVLKRSPSSLSRELKRNKTKGRYCPVRAWQKTRFRQTHTRYQWQKIREYPYLEKFIIAKLKLYWTPERIAGRLELLNNNQAVVSVKTIYNWLNSRWGKPYRKYLKYGKRRRGKKKGQASHIKNRVSIEERPVIINNRGRLGDWEGDTMGVPRDSKETLPVLVDRKSRYLLAKKVSQLGYTIEGFKEMLNSVEFSKSLTLDNGLENIRWQELKIDTYFCHPYSAWEKGSVENVIREIRYHIPKKSRLESYSDERISDIVNKLNHTPRKVLGFRTPFEVLHNLKPIDELPRLATRTELWCCT